MSERLKEQHWKCCIGLKPDRGFESPPLRIIPAARRNRFIGSRLRRAVFDPYYAWPGSGPVGLEVHGGSGMKRRTSSEPPVPRR